MSSLNFNDLIHGERGKLLRRLPAGAKTICSAGCAGRWYFDWIEAEYGPVDLHIGVELYSQKPTDLPHNVRWIQNSVSDMVDVESGSVDLLISGQNIEHLYYDDLVGFLEEANRVVRQGGYLCVDSPNRSVTQELGYTQPQHVLELSVTEAVDLIEAAGFTIVDLNGIWNCVDGDTLRAEPLKPSDDAHLRCITAESEPSSSFIWWIVAMKTGSVRPELPSVVDRIVAHSFRPFVAARFRKGVGRIHSIEGTETVIQVSPNERGYVFFGPYIPLRAGNYVAEFDVKFLAEAGAFAFDVAGVGGTLELATAEVKASEVGKWRKVRLEFSLADYTQGVETRVTAKGAEALVRFGTQIVRL